MLFWGVSGRDEIVGCAFAMLLSDDAINSIRGFTVEIKVGSFAISSGFDRSEDIMSDCLLSEFAVLEFDEIPTLSVPELLFVCEVFSAEDDITDLIMLAR